MLRVTISSCVRGQVSAELAVPRGLQPFTEAVSCFVPECCCVGRQSLSNEHRLSRCIRLCFEAQSGELRPV
jgi:hypothetical protein